MKKKTLIYILLTLVIILTIGFIVYRTSAIFNKSSYTPNTVSNLKSASFDIPDFAVLIKGTYEGDFFTAFLEEYNTPTYEFDATIDNGWEVKTNHYKGIKLIDALEELGIDDYSTIEFAARSQVSVLYKREEITEDMYLVFYRDDKVINDTDISLLAVDKGYWGSLDDIYRIYIG